MKRPNILIVYTDQQRWDALGANGNKEIQTPHLDKLAEQGVNFQHHYVQNPICMPSRASFLTGLYPSALGITHMAVPLPEESVTLPKMLKNAGYVSGNIGKLHALPHSNRDHRDIHPSYGFDHLEISDEPGCYEDAYRAWARAKAPEEAAKISLGLPPATETWYSLMGIQDDITHIEREPKHAVPFPAREDLTHSAFVAEQTMAFIEKHQQDTWCCIAGFYSPHTPWVAPQSFLDLYDAQTLSLPDLPEELDQLRREDYFSDEELRSVKHGYYAMVSEVDHYVGQIRSKLEELQLDDNTLIVFTSDHGEYLGDHLRYQKGYPGEDCISRVPLMIYWPQGMREAGRSCTSIVEAVDVLPTLLDCAGIQIPSHLQGTSLLPALRNEPFAGKACALMEFTGWRNIRTQQYRYLCEDNGKEGLYDLQKDPMQYHNLAQDIAYAEVLADMRKLLIQKMIQVQQPRPRTWVY
ncbi:sulfatase family protein [Marinicrinis sediminis]|uniref:Sulfatase n=1 Tax=Marinicrinis sediminis TaxID=1652465 RepID=A0ABW5R744_9BACL